jgi:hypothetical protein
MRLEQVAVNITRIENPGRSIEQALSEYEEFTRERTPLEAIQ